MKAQNQSPLISSSKLISVSLINMQEQDYDTKLLCVEVGSRGIITDSNVTKVTLSSFIHVTGWSKFAGIVMTSSSGINTAMHTVWSVLAQAPSKYSLFIVFTVL